RHPDRAIFRSCADSKTEDAMTLMIVRHKVRDFAAWKAKFDGHKPAQQAAALSNSRVYRSALDPNEVVILFDVGSIDKAKAFGTSADLKAEMASAGVIDQPTVFLLNEA